MQPVSHLKRRISFELCLSICPKKNSLLSHKNDFNRNFTSNERWWWRWLGRNSYIKIFNPSCRCLTKIHIECTTGGIPFVLNAFYIHLHGHTLAEWGWKETLGSFPGSDVCDKKNPETKSWIKWAKSWRKFEIFFYIFSIRNRCDSNKGYGISWIFLMEFREVRIAKV